MTRSVKSPIRDSLTSLFSPQLIRHHAAALGAVKRRRKVDIVSLVYTLILAFDRGATRNLASLRRAYAAATGTTLAPSAFYDRFTPSLKMLMQKLTERALAKLAQGDTKKQRALGAFAKLVIADGSLVRLPDALEHDYPSVWTNHMRASAKVHVIINGTTRTPEHITIAPGSSHDLPLMTLETCCVGSLCVRLSLLPRQAFPSNHRARRALSVSREKGRQLSHPRCRRRELGRSEKGVQVT
jgi:hypothetical protein